MEVSPHTSPVAQRSPALAVLTNEDQRGRRGGDTSRLKHLSLEGLQLTELSHLPGQREDILIWFYSS